MIQGLAVGALAFAIGVVAITMPTAAQAVSPRPPAPALTCSDQVADATATSEEDRRLLAEHPGGLIQSCHPAGYPDHIRVHRMVTASSVRPHDVCGYRIFPITLMTADGGERRWRLRRENESPYMDAEEYLYLSKDSTCPKALDGRYTRVNRVDDVVFIRTMTEIAAILEERSIISRGRFLDGKGPCASQTYDCVRVLVMSQASNWRQEKHTDVSFSLDLDGQRIYRELRLTDSFTGMLR